MVVFIAAFVAAPIIYSIAKHYVPEVGIPAKKIKEATGYDKFEKQQPELALITELAVDYAIFKGAGKVGKAPKLTKAAIAAAKARKARKVSRSISLSRKRKLFTYAGKGEKRITILQTPLKTTSKYTISRWATKGGSKSVQVIKNKQVNRWTGKTITSRSGRKYKSLRSVWKLTKISLKRTGGGLKSTAGFVSRNPKFVIQSWVLQDALIKLNERFELSF